MKDEFQGNIYVVTGGASGIGLACAKQLLAYEAHVVTIDREQMSDLKLQSNLEHIVCDLTESSAVERIFAQIEAKYSKIAGAVNNAGIIGPLKNQFTEYTIDDYEQVMNTNVKSVWYCMHQELTIMEKHQQGAIVNVSSVAGLRGSILSALYSMSKFALNGLTCAAALEYAERGIRINAVCPGPTDTPLTQQVAEATNCLHSQIMQSIPMGKMAQPEDIAHAILWLLSKEASFITGSAIPVDGGIIAKL